MDCLVGNVTPKEIMAYGEECRERDITVAVLASGVVVDVAVFREIEMAWAFVAAGVWPGADAVAELPEGFGVGDLFDGETWTKGPQEPDEPDPGPEPPPTGNLAEINTAIADISKAMGALLEGLL